MSTIMNSPAAVPKTSQRYLWLAVAGFAATSLALGAALVQVNQQTDTAQSAKSQLIAPAPAPTQTPTQTSSQTPPSALKTAAKAHVPVAAAKQTPDQSNTPAPQPVACSTCGTVQAVTTVQHDAEKGSGAGAVAGALLGGLVGNQFGGGNGKTLATIAGAVGGGYAGNAVEKKMKKVTVYRVEVRMANGTTRTIEQSSPATVGAQVKVEGNALKPV